MPVIDRIDGWRIFFFSNEGGVPHVHVDVKGTGKGAKIWLKPVSVASNGGLNSAELRKVVNVVDENKEKYLEAWNEYFKG